MKSRGRRQSGGDGGTGEGLRAASSKAGGSALRGHAPGAGARVPLRTWGGNLILWMATVGLLSLAFPPVRWSWVAHVALVPMLLAVARAPNRKVLLGSAAAAGLVLYGGQMYWMYMVTWSAYVGVVLYCLIFWLLLALLLRWTLRRTHLPLVLLAPAIWVSLEWCRSWVLTGFPWLFLGHPQAASPVLLQLADLTGVYGLSALSAATSGLLADGLTRPFFLRYGQRIRVALTLRVSFIAVLAAWAAVLLYGAYRLCPVEMRDGPLVVAVQCNVPQHLMWVTPEEAHDEEKPREDMAYKQLTEMTDAALAEGNFPEADLVVWPETALAVYLNPWHLNTPVKSVESAARDPALAKVLKEKPEFAKVMERLRRLQGDGRRYWREIHARLAGRTTAMLVGVRCMEEDGAVTNSALLYEAGDRAYDSAVRYDGTGSRYDKVHLVPFGEFVPFRQSAPWLYRWLMTFTPYDGPNDLTAGKEFTVMRVGDARFGVPICFEDAFADVCRAMIYSGGTKRADFLVNISNDGWFYGTIELEQHWDLSVFRAVEMRVPVVRCANTGISGFIDSTGRTMGRVTDERGWPRSVQGWLARRLKLDPRVTFYGRWGDVFAVVLSLGAAAIIIISIFNPRKKEEAS